jgi:hypothetical protein
LESFFWVIQRVLLTKSLETTQEIPGLSEPNAEECAENVAQRKAALNELSGPHSNNSPLGRAGAMICSERTAGSLFPKRFLAAFAAYSELSNRQWTLFYSVIIKRPPGSASVDVEHVSRVSKGIR